MTKYIERTEAEEAALLRVLSALRSVPRGSYIELDVLDNQVRMWRRTGPGEATMAGPAVRLPRKKVTL